MKIIGIESFNGCFDKELIFEEPCQVIKLEKYCFSQCFKLKKVDLPSSIQEICDFVFIACPLERIILRGTCLIKYRCFCINNLTYVHISDSIQELDENSFYLNKWVPRLNIPCKIYIRPEFHDEIKRMFE